MDPGSGTAPFPGPERIIPVSRKKSGRVTGAMARLLCGLSRKYVQLILGLTYLTD